MLQSVSFQEYADRPEPSQPHLQAAARTAAELKAGQPFEIVLRGMYRVWTRGRLDAYVDAIRSAGGGKVAVSWTDSE